MCKPFFGLFIVFACGTSVRADYVADRKAALESVYAGKHDAALAAFTKMAASAKSDFQKSDALEQAVFCALSTKKYDLAMEMARQIPLAPVSKTCQMRVLAENRRWQELVDKFGQEDIATWPEGVDGEAFFVRGRAYYVLKLAAKAEADLTKAGRYLTDDNSKGLALNALGDTYRHLLKDDARAIEAYRSVYQTRNPAKQSQAAMSIAQIFTRRKQHAEAVQELQKINLGKLTSGYWRGSMLHALGEALAAQGQKAEAVAKFQEALQVPGIYAVQKEAWEKDLKRLQADAR